MNRIELALETFNWLDLTNPTREVLEQIAIELELEPKVLYNCLDPDYLPHVEFYGATQFILLRLMEPEFKMTADSVQELTTKIALFVTPDRIISIHRLPLFEIQAIREKINRSNLAGISRYHLLSYFFEQVALGFDSPINELERNMEKFEEQIFRGEKAKQTLLDGYYLKRKASAFKKVLKFTIESMNKIINRGDCNVPLMQEIRDRFERNLFYADDVYENVQSLLNLHLAIASQKTNEASFKTNEIVRVLTVLTIFFLPLNFLAGVYGMNFEYIPLLQHHYGFFISLGMMLAMSLGLSIYVVKKGWMKAPAKN